MAEKGKKTEYKWRSTKREFISLKEGQQIEGVYLGQAESQFGACYKIRTPDGIKLLSGNRAQLDGLFEDLHSSPDEFPKGPEGHYIAVRRLEDTESKSGRTVGQYQLAHVIDKCSPPCVPF